MPTPKYFPQAPSALGRFKLDFWHTACLPAPAKALPVRAACPHRSVPPCQSRRLLLILLAGSRRTRPKLFRCRLLAHERNASPERAACPQRPTIILPNRHGAGTPAACASEGSASALVRCSVCAGAAWCRSGWNERTKERTEMQAFAVIL